MLGQMPTGTGQVAPWHCCMCSAAWAVLGDLPGLHEITAQRQHPVVFMLTRVTLMYTRLASRYRRAMIKQLASPSAQIHSGRRLLVHLHPPT